MIGLTIALCIGAAWVAATKRTHIHQSALAFWQIVFGIRGSKTARLLAISGFLAVGVSLGIFAGVIFGDRPETQAVKIIQNSAPPSSEKQINVPWDGNPNHADCSPEGHPDPKHPGVVISDLYTDNCPLAPNQPHAVPDLENVQYLSDKYGFEAAQHCAGGADDYLRTIAKYDFAWDQVGLLELKFDNTIAHANKPGVLMLFSRKAKLQNGFGDYRHIVLYCDYDTQTQAVSFRVER